MPEPARPPIPPLLARLVDDAAVFPPGNAPLTEALAAHAGHRAAWYADLVGPFLVPASALGALDPEAREPRFGVVADTGLDGLSAAFAAAAARQGFAQFEMAVAKRGEDPAPGLRVLLAHAGAHPDVDVYAEVPLTGGLLGALDTLAAARAAGARVAPKFRCGGLAAELYPTPVELAAVICACRERKLPFKLTAGLHRALRHTEPETGFVHHGFLNVLAATLATADGAEVADVAELLGTGDPVPLIERVRVARDRPRPLWVSFGTCSIDEPLSDLVALGLAGRGELR
jgi:hypothetical protein